MAEYIERDRLYELGYWHGATPTLDNPFPDGVDAVDTKDIDSIPAADVRPVVRGTWVGIDDFPHEDWECDHCGCVVGNTDDPWNYYHFCPNCGADMREES